MKRIVVAAAAVLGCMILSARDRVVERTYLSTDKTCYVAGDNIWMSAFCLDAGNGGHLSDFSSIAYVELCSAKGVEATAKIALDGGRGAGVLPLPRALPTGNYKLIAYTAQNRNEVDYDYFVNARTISVFNTFTPERVEDNVRIISDSSYGRSSGSEVPDHGAGGEVSLALSSVQGRVAHLTLSSALAQASSLSVSVYHEDAIASPRNEGVADFLRRTAATGHVEFEQRVIPDFEGEVIRARCSATENNGLEGCYAVISLPGDLSGIYFSEIGPDGEAVFYTNNYYGDNVLVCEIDGDSVEGKASIEFESPFVDNRAQDIEPLELCEGIGESLSARSTGMQIERLFDADTLYEMLPRRPDLFLSAAEPVTYILNDYTRFPVMNEVFVEFVKGLRFRHQDKKTSVQIVLTDASRPGPNIGQKCLVLIDGVPVLDHQRVYDYDPHLVERIDIYPSTYFIGPRCCGGVVDMVTFKGNMPSLTFPESVRIVDFQGAGFPMAYTCRNVDLDDNYPDYRSTLYWHPAVDLPAGGVYEFDCRLPLYSGRFRVVVEGITADGRPVSESMVF